MMTPRERLSALLVVLLIFSGGFGLGYWSGQRNERADAEKVCMGPRQALDHKLHCWKELP